MKHPDTAKGLERLLMNSIKNAIKKAINRAMAFALLMMFLVVCFITVGVVYPTVLFVIAVSYVVASTLFTVGVIAYHSCPEEWRK